MMSGRSVFSTACIQLKGNLSAILSAQGFFYMEEESLG